MDNQESMSIPVKALDAITASSYSTAHRSNTPSPSSAPATSPLSQHRSDITMQSDPPQNQTQTELFTRVAQLPFVGSVMSAYEHGKASSRVVKYGAEMVESSVKTISRPVIERLPVNQLDEFACRQLDRLGKYGGRPRSLSREPPRKRKQMSDGSEREGSPSFAAEKPLGGGGSPSFATEKPLPPEDTNAGTDAQPISPSIQSPPPSGTEASRTPTPQPQEQQVATRSRWQTVLLEAGGIGAAVSEESMRKLKYCLHWLQYATAHIDAQILVLRDFIHKLSSSATPSQPSMGTLADVRRDVVRTIRQVVDVVSHYAGGALPEPARARVRSVILGLPGRWASAVGSVGVPVPVASRRRKGAHRRNSGSGEDEGEGRTVTSALVGVPGHGQAMYAAQRVLMLATEGLDMMRGVTGVVKESLDRAETWVGRMRAVGVVRGEGGGDGDAEMTQQPEGEVLQERTHMRMGTGGSGTSSSASSSLMTEEEYSPPETPTESTTAVSVMSLESLVSGKGGEGRQVKEMELDG